MKTVTTFKRLNVGDKFISDCKASGVRGEMFRKHNKNQAIHISPETGRGNTAVPVTFSRSHTVITN